jgi:hypothetical protein
VGRGVGVFDHAVGIDHEHAFLQGVEDVLEQAALAGEALHEVGEVDRVERVEAPEHAVERGVAFGGHGRGENGGRH